MGCGRKDYAPFLLALTGAVSSQRYLRSLRKDTALQSQIKGIWGHSAKGGVLSQRVGWKRKGNTCPQNANGQSKRAVQYRPNAIS